MRIQSLLPAIAALFLAVPALAHDGVKIVDPYARFLPGAKSGAVYMEIRNHSLEDDHLIGASTPVAAKAEAHGNRETAEGMMQMLPFPDGLDVPGLVTVLLAPGGAHLMLTDLVSVPKDGETFPMVLEFRRSGKIEIDVPVDNKRKAGGMEGMDGMKMNHDMSSGG